MPYKNIELSNASVVAQQAPKTSHFYKGFSSLDSSNSGSRLYDFQLIQQDIINHFNTRKGSRVMNPGFGSAIWDLMMEPMTDEVRQTLIDDIKAICTFDPRVTPIQMNLTEYEKGYLLELTLLLNGTNQSSNLKLTFDQEVGLSIQ
jgi:phage baseplate assembly protein W